jgi:hypothetical protein
MLKFAETFEDTKQFINSKAALVYCKHNLHGGCSSSGAAEMGTFDRAALSALNMVHSNSSSAYVTAVPLKALHFIGAVTPPDACVLCLSWLSQQPHPCTSPGLRPFDSIIGGKASHCKRCLTVNDRGDDGLALLRAAVHHHMTVMLLNFCFPQPRILRLRALSYEEVRSSDQRQKYVFLSSADLAMLHTYWDTVMKGVISHYSTLGLLGFDMHSSAATVALALIVLLLAAPSILAARQRGDCRRSRRRATSGSQKLLSHAYSLLHAALCRAVHVMTCLYPQIHFKQVLCRVLRCMCYSLVRYVALFCLRGVPIVGLSWSDMLQQQQLGSCIDYVVIPVIWESKTPFIPLVRSLWLFARGGSAEQGGQVKEGVTAVQAAPCTLQQEQQSTAAAARGRSKKKRKSSMSASSTGSISRNSSSSSSNSSGTEQAVVPDSPRYNSSSSTGIGSRRDCSSASSGMAAVERATAVGSRKAATAAQSGTTCDDKGRDNSNSTSSSKAVEQAGPEAGMR